MKFNIDDYMGNYAMHCKTKKEAIKTSILKLK